MPDYRALAQALDPYAMDTGGITPDTLKALQTINKSPNLLGMIGDIGRGGLSNLESLVRGGVAQVPGTAGDLETLGRMGINTSFGAGGVKVSPKAVMPTTSDILGMMPQRFTQARPETAGMEELGTMIAPGLAKAATPVVKGGGNLLGMAMNERLLAGQPILPSLAKEPQSAMFAVQPIDLNKGIYKPELTMDEMLKVKDIPTVDRVKQSIDLVGEDQFKKMVNAQYQKYKPTDQDQEAMLVESVTLNILGKAQRNAEKTGLPTSITNKSEVKNVADDFANQFKQMGFEVTLDHSGSKAGASSYLRVSDPTTGRFLNKPIRISDHSKGAKELDANINVLNPQEDFAKITSILTDMRKMGATLVVKQDKYAQELIANGVNPKIAYQKAKTEITENKQ
jgi:competence protein ComGC